MPRLLVFVALAAVLATASVAFAASPNQGAKKLPGIWVTTIKGKQPASLNGDWAIQFLRDGDYKIAKHVANKAKLLVKGEAYLFGTKGVTFKNETGLAACKGKQAVGRYTWDVVGKTLRFGRIHDDCIGRRTVLGATFKKF